MNNKQVEMICRTALACVGWFLTKAGSFDDWWNLIAHGGSGAATRQGKGEGMNDNLYERIGKDAIIEALSLYGDYCCERCVVGEECDGERSCEAQIADVLWARAEARA